MDDFFEIDFLSVESPKSGDAITMRYRMNGFTCIQVVDAGFTATGDHVVAHIQEHYANPHRIDHVVVTHPDGDHAAGVKAVLEAFQIGTLWMLRPWVYAPQLLQFFPRFQSVEALVARLRKIYRHLSALEETAALRGIPIAEPFQGATIGAFSVLSPSRPLYAGLILNSERTPESDADELLPAPAVSALLAGILQRDLTLVRAGWGEEVFSSEETSAENNMSVVQFARIAGHRILLTGDAGRVNLEEALRFGPAVGWFPPGVDRFQIPHHGSRRNLSSEILDRIIGPIVPQWLPTGQGRTLAVVSSAKEDPDHPRKVVVRALIHRGARVFATEGRSIRLASDALSLNGWTSVEPEAYPQEQESETA